jgi:hypothetical protein
LSLSSLSEVSRVYLSGVGPQRGLRGKPLAANVTMEGTIFQPLELRLVIAKVLLEVRQLDEGAAALQNVALVRPLS